MSNAGDIENLAGGSTPQVGNSLWTRTLDETEFSVGENW